MPLAKLETILVVDDAPLNIAMIAGLLKDKFKIKVATHGEKAIALANGVEPPDLILLDIMMPEMDGYEVCRRLKADPKTAEIPIIFLTAKSDTVDEEAGFALGGVDYIQKPFSPALVLARISTQLSLRRAVDTARAAQKKADDLLRCLLPEAAAAEIQHFGSYAPRRHEQVAVLFCDIVNFTSYCDRHEPEQVIGELDVLYKLFEEIIEKHGLEKIKTIGDALMCAGGLLKPLDDPLNAAARCGLEMIRILKASNLSWKIRVGIDFGSVIAGIVGQQRYQYDIWGSTVNLAARMATFAEVNSVAFSAKVFGNIADRYNPHVVSNVYIKGKGRMDIVHVTTAKQALAEPNATLGESRQIV